MGYRHMSGGGRARALRAALLLTAVLLSGLLLAAVAIGAGVDMRVSTDSAGNQANDGSWYPAISADGGHVAFSSWASNLVAAPDTNGAADVFVKDTLTGVTTLASADPAGNEGSGVVYYSSSANPSLSANGRYVGFDSLATNFVAGDTNGASDVFIKDTLTNTITRVSTDSVGNQASYGSNSYYAALSANGHFVAFVSTASNLVAGDTNGAYDIFVKDTLTGATTRVSTDSSGGEAYSGYYCAISANGLFVAFNSTASSLVAGDTNGASDIFVKDRLTQATTRVSTSAGGVEANGPSHEMTISADGRFVAFRSDASNLVAGDTNGASDIFVKDTVTGTVTRASADAGGAQANAASQYEPSISADGRFVAFNSMASNLAPGDYNGSADIFVKDTLTGAINLVSIDMGQTYNGGAWAEPALSANGQYVAFSSYNPNMVPGDTNGVRDVFRAGTSMPCTAGTPSLSLAQNSVYWASYADYLAQTLSIDFTVTNGGVPPAYIVEVVGATATNGVYCSTCTASLGIIPGGGAQTFTLKYFIPVGTMSFSTAVYVTAQDGCGDEYSFPGPYPGL